MKYRPEAPPLQIDPIVGEYLSRELWRMWEALNAGHDHDVLYALPDRVIPGMVRWFADGTEWPDQTAGGNQNQSGTTDGNGPGPADSGTPGLYEYIDYDTGWQKL